MNEVKVITVIHKAGKLFDFITNCFIIVHRVIRVFGMAFSPPFFQVHSYSEEDVAQENKSDSHLPDHSYDTNQHYYQNKRGEFQASSPIDVLETGVTDRAHH